MDAVDQDLGLKSPFGTHNVKKAEQDFKTLVGVLNEKGKVFLHENLQERQYQHFHGFRKNILESLDHRSLNKWLTIHIKEIARFEKTH